MRTTTLTKVVLGLALLTLTGCHSAFYADRGAGFGALAGALTGAAIGESNGDAAAGAIIGAGVGSLAGAAIGSSIDQDIARSAALVEAHSGRQIQGAVSVDDVVALRDAGVSDTVILTHIQTNGIANELQPHDLIVLSQHGISDLVIQSMQQATPAGAVVPTSPAAPPVIVEEYHHYGPPVFVHPHRRWSRRPRPGVHWSVQFGN